MEHMDNKGVYWEWYWGFSQDELELHSPKKKFTDFDKMKDHSAKHSAEYKWIGSGYWSNYVRLDKNETIEKPKMFERWVEVPHLDYSFVFTKSLTLEPTSTSASLHIYEEQYLIDGSVYRFLWLIDCEDKENTYPDIEKQEFYTANLK